MGAIPSVSLPAITTCAKDLPCSQKCYAARICKFRKNVRLSYENNLKILKHSPDTYWYDVEYEVTKTDYFRFHVSGDIVDQDYFVHMIDIARRHSDTQILAFTKKYDIVNSVLDNLKEFPSNLHIVFSAWPGIKMNNPHQLPVAEVIFRGQSPQNDWKICEGNCFDCASRNSGCWNIEKGETIAFSEH